MKNFPCYIHVLERRNSWAIRSKSFLINTVTVITLKEYGDGMELYYGNCDSNAKMVSKIANATKVAINDFRIAKKKNGTNDEHESVGVGAERSGGRGEWMENKWKREERTKEIAKQTCIHAT